MHVAILNEWSGRDLAMQVNFEQSLKEVRQVTCRHMREGSRGSEGKVRPGAQPGVE